MRTLVLLFDVSNGKTTLEKSFVFPKNVKQVPPSDAALQLGDTHMCVSGDTSAFTKTLPLGTDEEETSQMHTRIYLGSSC